MKEKIQKLLNQAIDTEGTPESEAFYRKAFELMARHGLSERDLEQEEEGVHSHEEELSGTYTDMKALLLANLADGLHCVAISYVRPRSTAVDSVRIFGLSSHIDRVLMLYRILWPPMITASFDLLPQSRVSTVVLRRSYMRGFIYGISSRLKAAEESVADSKYALVLIDDSRRARQAMEIFMENHNLHSASRQHGRSEVSAFSRGVADSSRADLQQTRFESRKELSS